MHSNTVPKRRQVIVDVGPDINEGIRDIILQDFQRGEITDIEMSPSKYIRDILSHYIKYRKVCDDKATSPLMMSEIIDSLI
jgi:hypothetical protein